VVLHDNENRKKKMDKEKIIDKEEFERCKNDEYYFFKKYILINGKEPLMTREQFYELISSWNTKQKRDE
jgi:hypothetical protein